MMSKFLHTQPGVLCNPQCPDELRLGELTSNNWHTGIKIGIAVLINAIAVFCVIMKLASKLWLYRLEKKQNDYLQSLDEELEVTDSATLPVMRHQHTVCYYSLLHNGSIVEIPLE